MQYRPLGRTGLVVSEIGFGCGNVGGLMVRGTPAEQLDCALHAVELGINYFDTAPQYGDGRSETNLGPVLARLPAGTIVATKVTIGPDVLKDPEDLVRASVERSLRRLGRDRIDVLQVHTPITVRRDDPGRGWSIGVEDVLAPRGIAEAIEAVRARGLVRFLGFTGLGDTEALHAVVDSGRFDVVQAYYNLLNPSAGTGVPGGFKAQDFGRLIDRAARRGMGVVVIRVMAGGSLGGPVARTGHASPSIGGALSPGSGYKEDERRAGKLGFLVEGSALSLPQAAVRFGLMHQGVSTVLVGFSDRKQIREAAACSGGMPIPDANMKRLSDLWSTDFGAA